MVQTVTTKGGDPTSKSRENAVHGVQDHSKSCDVGGPAPRNPCRKGHHANREWSWDLLLPVLGTIVFRARTLGFSKGVLKENKENPYLANPDKNRARTVSEPPRPINDSLKDRSA